MQSVFIGLAPVYGCFGMATFISRYPIKKDSRIVLESVYGCFGMATFISLYTILFNIHFLLFMIF